MSALGQKQTCHLLIVMSVLRAKADIPDGEFNVRFVPIADIAALIGSHRQPGQGARTGT
jgi:hypothetical protein